MKRIFLIMATFAIAVSLNSCDILGGNGKKANSLRWAKADIVGASYITKIGDGNESESYGQAFKSTENNQDLFKVDSNGNLTAIIFYFEETETEDGEVVKTEMRSDIIVRPISGIGSIADGEYIYFSRCEFFSGNSRIEMEDGLLEEYGETPSFLVKASTGAVYFVPESAESFFDGCENNNYMSGFSSEINIDGYLIINNANVDMSFKIEFLDNKATLTQITPSSLDGFGTCVPLNLHDTYVVSENATETDIISSYFGNGGRSVIIYPDLSMEEITCYSNNPSSYWNSALFRDSDKSLKLFTITGKEGDYEHATIQLYSINVGTSAPCTTSLVAETEVEGISVSTFIIDEVRAFDNMIVFSDGSLYNLVSYDRETQQFSTHPDINNSCPIPGIIYNWELGITSIDTETKEIYNFDYSTLTCSIINYDDSSIGGYIENYMYFYNGTYTISGSRLSDGYGVVIYIDAKTGEVTSSISPDGRQIIDLIKVG